MHHVQFDVEVDEGKADPDKHSDMEVRKYALMMITQKLLSKICGSANDAPATFREICEHICTRVNERWPEHSLKSVGAFVFLRFFTPAIMTPFAYGLVPNEPTPSAQRILILVAKVLQNAANEVEFGKKEAYMMKVCDGRTRMHMHMHMNLVCIDIRVQRHACHIVVE